MHGSHENEDASSIWVTEADFWKSHPAWKALVDKLRVKEPSNFRTARVSAPNRSGSGFREVAKVEVAEDGTLIETGELPEDARPSDDERKSIKKEFTDHPPAKPMAAGSFDTAPEPLRRLDPQYLFLFKNPKGGIEFVQHWLPAELSKSGMKQYFPWTFWSDGKWRRMEPDRLPLWGMDQLSENTTIFLHEGAKAARHVRWMVEGRTPDARAALAAHPWRQELKDAAHLGWVGGAKRARDTDWGPLRRSSPSLVYVVCDKDPGGEEAAVEIARQLAGTKVVAIRFDTRFDRGFDLADDWPPEFWDVIDGESVYRGPSMADLKEPATWATKKVATGARGRPTYDVTDPFLSQWRFTVNPPLFYHEETGRVYGDQAFNRAVAPFSDVSNTAALLVKHFTAQADGICYEPNLTPGLHEREQRKEINVYRRSNIRPEPGDVSPFLAYLEHLIPNEADCHELKRWIATLIAKPETRVPYGVLLISEVQGVGKTTLGEKILAPLVGLKNVSTPSEREVVASSFNSWIRSGQARTNP